jgi:hypothetical protein
MIYSTELKIAIYENHLPLVSMPSTAHLLAGSKGLLLRVVAQKEHLAWPWICPFSLEL